MTKAKGWRVVLLKVRGRRVHVLPVADLRRHDVSAECWCKPVASREGKGMRYAHNAEDGRELIERHGIN